MVSLKLQPLEAKVLHRVLDGYLSELRMEISNTENWELKGKLKEEEKILESISAELEKGKGAK